MISQPEKSSVTSNERLMFSEQREANTDQEVEWDTSCSVSDGGARTCKWSPSACVRMRAENGLPAEEKEQPREKAGSRWSCSCSRRSGVSALESERLSLSTWRLLSAHLTLWSGCFTRENSESGERRSLRLERKTRRSATWPTRLTRNGARFSSSQLQLGRVVRTRRTCLGPELYFCPQCSANPLSDQRGTPSKLGPPSSQAPP